ncbi:MAG: hypothetical protein QW645_01370 [Candidatus Bathyarchaeia archaeon]
MAKRPMVVFGILALTNIERAQLRRAKEAVAMDEAKPIGTLWAAGDLASRGASAAQISWTGFDPSGRPLPEAHPEWLRQ